MHIFLININNKNVLYLVPLHVWKHSFTHITLTASQLSPSNDVTSASVNHEWQGSSSAGQCQIYWIYFTLDWIRVQNNFQLKTKYGVQYFSLLVLVLPLHLGHKHNMCAGVHCACAGLEQLLCATIFSAWEQLSHAELFPITV